MSSYIGGVQLSGSEEQLMIGSSLYGYCEDSASTASKKIILPNFDRALQGITVHIKFNLGNTATSGVTLAFYASNASGATAVVNAVAVSGTFICEANSVIAFTFKGVDNDARWYVNNSVNIAEGSTNGTISVNGQDIEVHGLGTAAYTDVGAYALSDHTHSEYAPKNNPTFTGVVTLPSIDGNSDANAAATKYYVDSKTQGLEGISGAMHYIDAPNATFIVTYPTPTEQNPNPLPTVTVGGTFPANYTPEAGDLIVYQHQEFVYTGSAWRLLGDEGSYVFKSSQTTASIGSASGWNAGSTATLGEPIGIDGITNWDAGSASSATVANGILILTNSVVPTLSHSVTNVPNVTSAGTAPSLTVTPTTVVVPNTSSST